MVEVLEGRAREPTGPIEAARSYAGPASPADRVGLLRSHREHDLLASGLLCLANSHAAVVHGGQGLPIAGTDFDRLRIKDIARARVAFRAPEIAVPRRVAFGEEREQQRRPVYGDLLAGRDHSARRLEGGDRGKLSDREETVEQRVKQKVVVVWDTWETVVDGSDELPTRLEETSEPGKGSCERCETGERNVAERRHGRPCGQQSMDEINGHCPQGKKASRLGVSRCRRFRGPGICDHRQQRPDPQSVSHDTNYVL